MEEARYADILIHVADVSSPQMDEQMHIVYETLRELQALDKPVITAFNKIDTAGANMFQEISRRTERSVFPQRQEKGRKNF